MVILTKAQLLAGSKYTEEIEIKELGGKVKIRALSDGEMSQIESQHMIDMGSLGIDYQGLQSMKYTPEIMTIDRAAKVAQLAKERAWKIVALALSVPGGEEWTPEEASGLHESTVDLILTKAEELSKGKRGQLESFRGDAGGMADKSPDKSGVQVN